MSLYRHFVLLAVACGVGSLGGCAPQPKSAACMTDGECTARGEGYMYCVESHCVKCLSDAMCNGRSCVDGVCAGR